MKTCLACFETKPYVDFSFASRGQRRICDLCYEDGPGYTDEIKHRCKLASQRAYYQKSIGIPIE